MIPSYDKFTSSRIYALLDKLGTIIILSLLWLLFTLPLVTAGTSSAALYFSIYKMTKTGSDTPVKDFFRSFKMNFRQGAIISVIFLLYAGIITFNIWASVKGIGSIHLPDWYFPISVILAVPLLLIYPFALPYLARFSAPVKKTLFNSFTFSTMYIKSALELLLIEALSALLMVFFPPFALVIPASAAFLRVYIAEKVFNIALEKEAERIEQENDNNE